jgi:hypothetical protein
MMSLFFFFFQLVAMQTRQEGLRCLQDFCKIGILQLHGWSSWLNWAHQHTFSNSTAHFQESVGMWGLSHSHKVHCQDYGANNQRQGCLFLSWLWGWCLFLQRIIGDASSLSSQWLFSFGACMSNCHMDSAHMNFPFSILFLVIIIE